MNSQRDKITLTGAVFGAASFLFPLVTLKPNRVDDGTALSWIETGAFIPLIIVVLLLALLLYWGVSTTQNEKIVLKSSTAFSVVFISLAAVGPYAGSLLDESIPYGRISLSPGFWIMMAAMFLLLNGMRHKIERRWNRLYFQLIPVLFLCFFLLSGNLKGLSILMEFSLKKSRVFAEIFNHLKLAGTAVFFSLIIGIPLGITSWKKKRSEKTIFYFLNSIQTIPSLALFGLLIAPLSYLSFRFPLLREMGIQGVGSAPALIALTLYALLPVARNTYIGLSVVDPDIIQAGRGMGMSKWQLFFNVEIPLALPVILTGIQISAIQAVGNTAVAALIGAGGLGTFIFQGLGQGAPDLILLGVIPVITLAVLLDRFLTFIFGLSLSPGLAMERN